MRISSSSPHSSRACVLAVWHGPFYSHLIPMKLKYFAAAAALALLGASGVFAQAKKSYVIGLVAKSQGNPVFQAARVGAEQAAKELGQKYNINIKIDWRLDNNSNNNQSKSIHFIT